MTNRFGQFNPSFAEFHVSDMNDFCPEKPFDVVFSMASLYYTVPMEKFARKVPQLVKPGTNRIGVVTH